jgi:hypothetical protein
VENIFNPRYRRNKYRRYREAWDLLVPERHNRRWFRKPKVAPSEN